MDDDNYLNPRALLKLLKTFPWTRDVYIGRPSLNRPIHASEPQPNNRTVGSLAASFVHWPLAPGAGPCGAGPCGGGAVEGSGGFSGFQIWLHPGVSGLVASPVILSLVLYEMGRLR